MKFSTKRLTIAMLVLCFFCFSIKKAEAEYQVFTYNATISRAEPTVFGGANLVKDTFTGYFITVSCFPCGASFGRGYQSWLVVTSAKLGKTQVWKLPCQVRGGLFGSDCNPKKFSDFAWLNPTDSDKALMNKGQNFFIEFVTYDFKALDAKKNSIMGQSSEEVVLWHSGYGIAKTKINNKTDDLSAVFNPYCKSLTGFVVGQYKTSSLFAWDPVNKGEKDYIPAVGEFKIDYSSTMTEKIRGIADWSKIFSIILSSMNVKKEVMEDYPEELMWSEPSLIEVCPVKQNNEEN